MLKRIAYHLGFRRWHGLGDIVKPLTRISAELETFADRSQQRAEAALAAHKAHTDAHLDARAWLAGINRIKSGA